MEQQNPCTLCVEVCFLLDPRSGSLHPVRVLLIGPLAYRVKLDEFVIWLERTVQICVDSAYSAQRTV